VCTSDETDALQRSVHTAARQFVQRRSPVRIEAHTLLRTYLKQSRDDAVKRSTFVSLSTCHGVCSDCRLSHVVSHSSVIYVLVNCLIFMVNKDVDIMQQQKCVVFEITERQCWSV